MKAGEGLDAPATEGVEQKHGLLEPAGEQLLVGVLHQKRVAIVHWVSELERVPIAHRPSAVSGSAQRRFHCRYSGLHSAMHHQTRRGSERHRDMHAKEVPQIPSKVHSKN